MNIFKAAADPLGALKDFVLGVNTNKNQTPDVLEALDGFQANCDKIQPFLDRIDNHDIIAISKGILSFLPNGKFSPAEVEEFAIGTMNTLRSLGKLKVLSENLEADLKKSVKK